MKRRACISGGIFVLLMSMIAGCSTLNWKNDKENAKSIIANDSIVSEPTEITFLFMDGDEGGKATWTEIVRRFNEQYEDITVIIEPGNGDTYSEILKTKDSIGEFPDVLETANTAAYIRAGKLAPLPENIVSLFRMPVEYEGAVYTATPAAANTCGIIYNKKYFSEKGLSEPTTYKEFIELCQEIQDLGDMYPLAVGGQDIWHIGFWFNKVYSDVVLSQDDEFIKHCYEGTRSFNDEIFKAVFVEMEEIMQYAQEGWVSTPDAQVATLLVNNVAAMVYSGTHMFGNIEEADSDFEMGWFAIPGQDGQMRLVGGSILDGIAISAESAEDPNKKAAAEEFIRFIFSDEIYSFYCESVNMIPTTVNVPEMDVSPLMQEVMDAVNEADELIIMWNSETGDKELPADFRNYTYKTLIEVLQGMKDIDSACEEINRTWEASIVNYNPVAETGAK